MNDLSAAILTQSFQVMPGEEWAKQQKAVFVHMDVLPYTWP